MNAYIFPGQGSQYTGMGKDLYEQNKQARLIFDEANEILGFSLTDVMFEGSKEALSQTKVTQPAVFVHSVAMAAATDITSNDVVAGHSLGEISALVANKTLSFSDGLRLVAKRAEAMQKACMTNPSAMAAILGLEDDTVEQVINRLNQNVVAANYNSPGQLVISGTKQGIEVACEKLKEAGAKRALPLSVSGGFHSWLMEPAKEELEDAIHNATFSNPICPIYQNVTALPSIDTQAIKKNLIAQLTAPVLWTQTVQNIQNDGIERFVECGPGKVLQGLVRKISKELVVEGV